MEISTLVNDYYINVYQIQWIKHIGNYEYEIYLCSNRYS